MDTIERWKKKLHSVDLPEMKALLPHLEACSWAEHREPYTQASYFIGTRFTSTHCIIHRCGAKIPKTWPSYLEPLADLKIAVPTKDHSEVLEAGGIADQCIPGQNIQPLTAQDWSNHPEWYNYGDPTTIQLPKDIKLCAFQSSPSGDMFFLNEKLQVCVFGEEGGLTPIASLEDFVRYQLHFLAEGKLWYQDGYEQKKTVEGMTIQFAELEFD